MAIKDKRSAYNSYWSKTFFDKLDTTLYRKSVHSEIYCYDKTGELYKIYDSVADIIDDLGFTKASIQDSCSHKIPLHGFYFISDDSDINDIIKTRELVFSLSDNSVSKYKDGKLVKTYPSIAQAAKENKISSNIIKKEIKANTGTWAYGYMDTYHVNSKAGVQIDQYDLEGNFIKTWDTYSQCRKEFPNVKAVLCGERKHTHGYTFKIHKVS